MSIVGCQLSGHKYICTESPKLMTFYAIISTLSGLSAVEKPWRIKQITLA